MVVEPKGTGEAFDGVMKDYYGAIKKGQGGLFMAVCRGKVTCTTHLTCGSVNTVHENFYWHFPSHKINCWAANCLRSELLLGGLGIRY